MKTAETVTNDLQLHAIAIANLACLLKKKSGKKKNEAIPTDHNQKLIYSLSLVKKSTYIEDRNSPQSQKYLDEINSTEYVRRNIAIFAFISA